MEYWKLPQLKAHQQFIAGRMDGLRWVLAQDIVLEPVDETTIKEKLRELELTDRDIDIHISRLAEAKLKAKTDESRRRSELHESFSSRVD